MARSENLFFFPLRNSQIPTLVGYKYTPVCPGLCPLLHLLNDSYFARSQLQFEFKNTRFGRQTHHRLKNMSAPREVAGEHLLTMVGDVLLQPGLQVGHGPCCGEWLFLAAARDGYTLL